jgi:hypothetical protein
MNTCAGPCHHGPRSGHAYCVVDTVELWSRFPTRALFIPLANSFDVSPSMLSSEKEEKQTNPSVLYPWSTLGPKRLDSEYEMWIRGHRRQRAGIGISDAALKSATFDSLVRPPPPAFVQWHPLSIGRFYSRRRTSPFQ